MKDLTNIITCFFFLAVPDFIFMVMLLIKFMNKRELLDVYRLKENIKWYIILITPPSLLVSVLIYGFKFQRNISSIISLILLYFISIYVFEKTKIEEVKLLRIKILIRFIPLYISLIAIDLATAPVLFYFLHLDFQKIYNDIHLLLICSLASRIIEFSIITFILTYKQRKFQVNLLEYIYKNTFFRRFVIITMILLMIFEICILKLAIYNNFLNILKSLTGQIVIVIGFIYLIPSIVIIGLYLIINHCVSLLNSVKQTSNLPSNEDDMSV